MAATPVVMASTSMEVATPAVTATVAVAVVVVVDDHVRPPVSTVPAAEAQIPDSEPEISRMGGFRGSQYTEHEQRCNECGGAFHDCILSSDSSGVARQRPGASSLCFRGGERLHRTQRLLECPAAV
jgi:hypothetical protein